MAQFILFRLMRGTKALIRARTDEIVKLEVTYKGELGGQIKFERNLQENNTRMEKLLNVEQS